MNCCLVEESFAVMPSDDKSGRVEVPKVEFVIDEYIEMVLQSSHSSDLRFLLAAINKASPVVLPLVGDDSRIVKPLELLQSVLQSEIDSCSGTSEAARMSRSVHTSRFARVMLAQGPCEDSLHRSYVDK